MRGEIVVNVGYLPLGNDGRELEMIFLLDGKPVCDEAVTLTRTWMDDGNFRYGFARFKFPFKNLLFACGILTLMVPMQTIILPCYMNMRCFDPFGLISAFNSVFDKTITINLVGKNVAFYLPSLFGAGIRSGLYIYIFRQFFEGMDKALEESAYIDGCGPLRTFLNIMLPNARNAIVTVFLFSFVWHTTEEAWLANKAENPEAFDLVWTTKEVFEQKYGGTVNVIGVDWGEQQSTIISMVNSGEVCDLGQAHDQNFPIYGAKNIVQDVSQYVDLEDGFWYDSCTNAFSFGGIPYAMGAEATPVVISYNKTLFEQNGVKTPMEYFEEGNWTWETFRDVALEMTGDTDGDGVNDVYGFGWWDSFYVQMLNANGIATIDYNFSPIGIEKYWDANWTIPSDCLPQTTSTNIRTWDWQ